MQKSLRVAQVFSAFLPCWSCLELKASEFRNLAHFDVKAFLGIQALQCNVESWNCIFHNRSNSRFDSSASLVPVYLDEEETSFTCRLNAIRSDTVQ